MSEALWENARLHLPDMIKNVIDATALQRSHDYLLRPNPQSTAMEPPLSRLAQRLPGVPAVSLSHWAGRLVPGVLP